MGAELAIPKDTVVAGDTLRGNFRFQLEQPTPFTSVSLKLVGKEYCALPEGSDHSLGKVNVHKQHITILGGPKGSNFKGELPPGEYDFPFEFQIPVDAPPTFKVGWTRGFEQVRGGRVEYQVQGCVGLHMVPVRRMINIKAPMPTSQYLTRTPVVSTPFHCNRTGCCGDNGRTEFQIRLPQNIYILDRDVITGTVIINNSESKAPCQDLEIQVMHSAVVRLHDATGNFVKEEKLAGQLRRLRTHVQCNVAPMEQEPKQFEFTLPLITDSHGQGSCYNGPNVRSFYELIVVVDGDVWDATASLSILMASGEDSDNRCPPIDMTTPRQAIAPGAYHKSVYPHGQVAGVVMPQQPPNNIPQPMSTGLSYESAPRGNGAVGGAAQGDVYGGGIYDQGVGVDIYGAQSSNHAPLLDTGASAFPDI